MSSNDELSPPDALSISHLREEIVQLLSLSQQLLQSEGRVSDKVEFSDAEAAAPPAAVHLKRLLRLRAERRRDPTGTFLEWPAWDMLLDLAAVGAEGGHISVSAICISSGAPQSTALRKLAQLERAGLVSRYLHDTDKRRVCLALTKAALELVNTRINEDLNFYTELSEAFVGRGHFASVDRAGSATPTAMRGQATPQRLTQLSTMKPVPLRLGAD